MTLTCVVVGSGPAGFYTADALLKTFSGCRVDILDRLPTPFGLIRAGVAPDHLSTKNVIRAFEKTLDKDGVRLLGNVEFGRDVTYAELKNLYDIVVLAQGAQESRTLNLPGEDLAGVATVTDFVGWYNGVPGARDCADDVRAATAAVVVGNGNVALDIARLLGKTKAELDESDIEPAAADAIVAAQITDIHVVGRRGPVESSFSFPELSEFGDMAQAVPLVDATQLPPDASSAPEDDRRKKQKNLDLFHQYAANKAADKPVRIHFGFFASPVALHGSGRLNAVELAVNKLEDGRAVATDQTFTIDAQLFIPAIGYRTSSVDGMPHDQRRGVVTNQDGRVEPGVYVVGWAKRGPSGVIGTNRVDARSVVEVIAADQPSPGKPGPDGIDALLNERGIRTVSTAEWRRIDAAETALGSGGRPRQKFSRVEDMLSVLDGAAA